MLAEATAGAQTGEALDVLTEALTTVQKTGERLYEAELQRLTGELGPAGAFAQKGTVSPQQENPKLVQQLDFDF
jgi:hypothetical protein